MKEENQHLPAHRTTVTALKTEYGE